MKIYVEDGNLKATRSCEICIHKDTCKFYAKAKDLFNSNEFYEMNRYLEWNNNLSSWSENKNCQYYLPFLFDKKLFELELKKENSFINAYSWYSLVLDYFNLKFKSKHKEYFKSELLKKKSTEWGKNKTDEEIYKYGLFKQSSNKKTYNITANDESWKYEISIIDVLEFFNAFKLIKDK